jgi:hypothetical protein
MPRFIVAASLWLRCDSSFPGVRPSAAVTDPALRVLVRLPAAAAGRANAARLRDEHAPFTRTGGTFLLSERPLETPAALAQRADFSRVGRRRLRPSAHFFLPF